MKIEELNVSKDCLDKWKKTGVTRVEEIVEFLEQVVGNAEVLIGWVDAECFDETLEQLKLMGLWPITNGKE